MATEEELGVATKVLAQIAASGENGLRSAPGVSTSPASPTQSPC